MGYFLASTTQGFVAQPGGSAGNLPSTVLSDIASAIHRGEIDWPVEVYAMEDIARAHDDMEHNRVAAKQVVLTRAE